MSLQAFVWAIRTLTILAAGAFWLLVTFLDPDVVGVYGTVLFYLLGSLLLFGFIYLSIIGTYRLLFGDEKAVHCLGIVVRQTALLLLGLISLLVLYKNNLWFWWSILLVAAFVLLLEFTLRALPYQSKQAGN